MRKQGTLFAALEGSRAPPVTPPRTPPMKSTHHDHLSFRPIKHPYGKPDKRGKFPYEKFHKAATGVSERARVRFFEMLRETDATLFAQIIEIGVMWNRLSVSDQMDYEDSIQLRG